MRCSFSVGEGALIWRVHYALTTQKSKMYWIHQQGSCADDGWHFQIMLLRMTLMRYIDLYWIKTIGSLTCIEANHLRPSIASRTCQRTSRCYKGTLGCRGTVRLIWNMFVKVPIQFNLMSIYCFWRPTLFDYEIVY